MKKIVISLVVSSYLLASGTINCVKDSSSDTNNANTTSNCFNAFDLNDNKSITTKIAGESFTLKVTNKCGSISNLQYSLVDENNNEISDNTINTTSKYQPIFSVKNSYPNVKVKFVYDRMVNTTKTETYYVTTPTTCDEDTSYTEVDDINSVNAPGNYKTKTAYTEICYTSKEATKEVPTTEKKHFVEYSTDNFAIRPDKFDINLGVSSIQRGGHIPTTIKTLNQNGEVTTNYSENSDNLNIFLTPTGVVQYTFNIQNGKAKSYSIITSLGNFKINIKEKIDNEYAIIDQDDTIDSCRLFEGQSNSVEVTKPSKYWAGTGTGDDNNDPQDKTIQTNIKQNVSKDLRFSKSSW